MVSSLRNPLARSQALCRVLGCDVALGARQQFVTHHELPDARRAQDRRIDMRVPSPFGVRLVVGGRLVEAHGIGAWRVEQLVAPGEHLFEDVGKPVTFCRGQRIDR